MKYMVFMIYVITVVQFINSKPFAKKNGTHKGHGFYKISGITNLVVGFLGMFAVNVLLRDRDVIPQVFVYVALIGFAITMLYGVYCIYKMLVTVEP